MFSDIQQQAVSAIRQSFQLLSEATDLSPVNENVTRTLTHLVRTLMQCQSPELTKFLLDTPELATERDKLPGLCGRAECEMEKFWAHRLISRPNCDLSEFWYFPEYSELCRAEIDMFKQQQFSKISFLGAGALPITAFLIARHCPDTPVACVDFDAEACDLSARLSRKIGLGNQVSVECGDALNYTPQDNELVICASLLQGRERIYDRLEQHDCTAMIVRDCEGAYQYLYKPAELPKSFFKEIARTEIDGRRINTSRYFVKAREVTHVSLAA